MADQYNQQYQEYQLGYENQGGGAYNAGQYGWYGNETAGTSGGYNQQGYNVGQYTQNGQYGWNGQGQGQGYVSAEAKAEMEAEEKSRRFKRERAQKEKQLAEEKEKNEAELKESVKAREELEDLILRIERHFKGEAAARKKAEELLQEAIKEGVESRGKVDEMLHKQDKESQAILQERQKIKKEREKLEEMRMEFEARLASAREEVIQAQKTLDESEQQVRQAEVSKKLSLTAEYNDRMSFVNAEVARLKHEVAYRSMMMNEEMENWRQFGEMQAQAALVAKSEVIDRQKELEDTKEKLDRMMEKLLAGREKGIELSAALNSHQRLMSMLPPLGGKLGGLLGGANNPMAKSAPHSFATGGAGLNASWPLVGGMKLPPLMLASHAGYGGMGGLGSMAGMYQQQQGGENGMGVDENGGKREEVSPGRRDYSHVTSRFRQTAEEFAQEAREAALERQREAKMSSMWPDRFREASRERERVAVIASRWN